MEPKIQSSPSTIVACSMHESAGLVIIPDDEMSTLTLLASRVFPLTYRRLYCLGSSAIHAHLVDE